MGCGAVCQVQTPLSAKHNNSSRTTMLALVPLLSTHPPLLPDKHLNHFTSSLRQNSNLYILGLPKTVPTSQQLPFSLVQKWRTVLYGLNKGDLTYRRCLGSGVDQKQWLNGMEQIQSQQELNGTQYHDCFPQIEKDLNRTFDFKFQTRKVFEKTLKRIANHFPLMGYTQGVNFVVGYLLIIGYSQSDTFWIFIHLAMNKRYLLLGLYEDGFPLANVYTTIFKNMLKRQDNSLFNHLYEDLMLDDSVWIFKWFITCYIYSFPLQVIKHIWDLMIQLGGIALVYFAVALVINLKQELLSIGDSCDMSQFLQSLKDLVIFNQHIKINEVVQMVYTFHLYHQDLNGIEHSRCSFYHQYFKIIKEELPSHLTTVKPLPSIKSPGRWGKVKEQKQSHRLHLWYIKLLEERLKFMQKGQDERVVKQAVPQEINEEDYHEMQKSLKMLEDKVVQNESAKQSQRSIRELEGDYFNQLVISQPLDPNLLSQELQLDNHTKLMTKISYDVGQQIDELEQESDNSQYQISQIYTNSRVQNSHSKEPSIQLDESLANKHKDVCTIDHLISNLEGKKGQRDKFAKANHLKIDTSFRCGFGLAGQNILSNLSGTNSQYSSIESSKYTYRPKKQKENNLTRNPKGNKVRNQALSQNSGLSNDRSSQHESSLGGRTEKDSISNFTHRQYKGPKTKDEYLDRRTQHELMVISHGPQKLVNNGQKETVSDIEIFNGEGLFKKKKRTYNRNSVVTSINQDLMREGGDPSAEIKPKRSLNDQESLESILQFQTIRKPRGPRLDSINYQI